MGAKVRIVRNQFVACEVSAKIDIQTAAEDRLQAGMPPGNSGALPAGAPLGANPADGLIDFRLVACVSLYDRISLGAPGGARSKSRAGPRTSRCALRPSV